MKLNYILMLMLLISSINTTAQPVLVGTTPKLGFATPVYTGDPILPGSPGANVTWDFSGIDVNQQGVVTVVAPNTTPHFAKYSASNFSIKISSGPLSAYNYYRFEANKLEVLGFGIGSGLAEEDHVLNHRLLLNFPFNYQQTATDSFRNGTDLYTDSIIYDGWGTLMTPYDTFSNVARTKTYTKDSAGVVVNITYNWYSSDSLFQIMSTDSFRTLVLKNVPGTTIGITRIFNDVSIKLYPNPASGAVTIDAGALIGNFALLDISGRMVKQETLSWQPKTISLDGVNPGIYFYTITGPDIGQKFTGKLVVYH